MAKINLKFKEYSTILARKDYEMATFANETEFTLRLCSWECMLPGLFKTYTIEIPSGSSRSMPNSSEYVVLYEDYQELGKYITHGAYGRVKWWPHDTSFQVSEKDNIFIITYLGSLNPHEP